MPSPGPSKGCPMNYPTLPISFHWAPLGGSWQVSGSCFWCVFPQWRQLPSRSIFGEEHLSQWQDWQVLFYDSGKLFYGQSEECKKCYAEPGIVLVWAYVFLPRIGAGTLTEWVPRIRALDCFWLLLLIDSPSLLFLGLKLMNF